MRFATTLFLAFVATGIGLYLYLDQTGILQRFLGEEPPPRLVAPVPKAITGFRFQNDGRPDSLKQLEIQEDGRWRVKAPVDDFADPEWVQSVLKVFASLRATDFLPDPQGTERSRYGLDTDTATTLSIDLSDGQTLHYQVGHPGPLENSCYLFPGEASAYRGTFVAAVPFADLAATPPTSMVDPILARFDPGAITQLTYRHGDLETQLQRPARPGGRWRLVAPIQRQADGDRIDGWLASLATLPIDEVRLAPSPENAADEETKQEDSTLESLEGEEHRITVGGDLETASPAALTLTFTPRADDPDQLRAQHSNRNLIYLVSRKAAENVFPKSVDSLREQRLLRVSAADLTAVVFTPQGSLPLRVEHSGAWLMNTRDGETALANPDQGERFLDLLNETPIVQYLESGESKEALYGLDEPLFTVKLHGEQLGPHESKHLVMRVGMPPGDSPHVFVHLEGTDFIAAVPKTFLTGIAQAADALQWKKLEVLNIPFERIRAVTMEIPGKETLTLKTDLLNPNTDQRLQLLREDVDRTADLNQRAAGQLLLDVGNLNADRWISVSVASALALADSTLRLSVSQRPPIPSEGAEGSEPSGGDEGETWRFEFAPVNAKVPVFYYGQRVGTPRPKPFLITRELYHRLSGKQLLLESPTGS